MSCYAGSKPGLWEGLEAGGCYRPSPAPYNATGHGPLGKSASTYTRCIVVVVLIAGPDDTLLTLFDKDTRISFVIRAKRIAEHRNALVPEIILPFIEARVPFASL